LLLHSDFSTEGLGIEDLFFDLSTHLSPTEALLIQRLRRHHSVWVLKPEFLEARSSPKSWGLRSYELLEGVDLRNPELKKKEAQASLESLREKSRPLQKWRLSNPMLEAESALAQVRRWIREGTPAEDIAILTPHLEESWALLDPLFRSEGLLLNKARVTRLINLPACQIFLTQLQEWIADFDPLLALIIESSEAFEIRRARTSQQDPQLDLHAGSSPSLNSADVISALDFFQLIGRCFTDAEVENQLAQALEKFFLETDIGLLLRPQSWAQALNLFLQRQEFRLHENSPDGIHLLQFHEGDFWKIQKRLYIQLSDESLKPASSSLLTTEDTWALAQEQGVYLPHPEESTASLEIRFQMQNEGEFILSTSDVNLNDEAQAPAEIWLEQSCQESHPENNSDFAGLWRSHRNFPLALMEPQIPAAPSVQPKLSPTSIQRYLNCPFQFYAEKILGLEQPPEISWKLDPRSLGTWLHAALEKMIRLEPLPSAQQIAAMLQNTAQDLKLQILEPRSLDWLKSRWARRLDIRLQEEQKRQQLGVKIWAVEHEFQCEIQGFQVRGKVDRIDLWPDGNFEILDYKIRYQPRYEIRNWLKENEIQLALYWKILESQSLLPGPISRASYVFLDQLAEAQLTRDANSGQDFHEIFTHVETKLNLALQKLSRSDYLPQPREDEICNDCNWRSLCREPRTPSI
ncbi:MAG: PD-(D/E)XK nuclease family protein, partial [Bdellovibrio sp.]